MATSTDLFAVLVLGRFAGNVYARVTAPCVDVSDWPAQKLSKSDPVDSRSSTYWTLPS